MIEIAPGHWNDRPPERVPVAAMLTAAPEPEPEPAIWVGETVKCDTLTCGRVATLEASDAHLVIVSRPMPWRAQIAIPCNVRCPVCKLVTFFEVQISQEVNDAESIQ